MNNYTVIGIVLVVAVASLGSGFYLSDFINQDSNEPNNSSFVQPDITIGEDDGELLSLNKNSDIFLSSVSIYVEENGKLSTMGSGFLYTDEHIMTNEHVVRNQKNVIIKYGDGEWSDGEVVGTDKHSDIAVIKADSVPKNAEPLPMQDELPDRTQPVVAIGAPRGLGDSVSTGIISATERNIQIQTQFSVPDTIQTDAALNRGNSGGPLINVENGAVVGVNRATEGENIGYAVSSRVADKVGQSLIETGDHEHSYMGVRTLNYNPLTEDEFDFDGEVNHGLIVTDTFNDGPAGDVFNGTDEAEKPDVITRIDDVKLNDNEDLSSYLMRKTEPGEEAEFEVYRDGEFTTLTMELGSRENIK